MLNIDVDVIRCRHDLGDCVRRVSCLAWCALLEHGQHASSTRSHALQSLTLKCVESVPACSALHANDVSDDVNGRPACHNWYFLSTFFLDIMSQPSLNRPPRNLHASFAWGQALYNLLSKKSPTTKNWREKNLKFRQ